MGLIVVSISFLLVFNCAKKNPIDQIIDNYNNGISKFDLKKVRIVYADNLNNISSQTSLKKQAKFFKNIQEEVTKIDTSELSNDDKIKLDILEYEINLHHERIAIEKEWNALNVKDYPTDDLSKLPLGKKWYLFWLKSWITDDASIEKLYQFGLDEVEKVKRRIRDIQLKSGLDSIQFYQEIAKTEYYIRDEGQVKQLLEEKMNTISKTYPSLFPYTEDIPKLKIAKGNEERLKLAPAYYKRNTFFFNMPQDQFNKRLADIFLIHEGFPGHHYQVSFEKNKNTRLFSYTGYKEAWACYVEELGKELELYNTWYDELGKWEWDLVRSVRVCIDIGLNYYGWSDEEAYKFWKQHIPNQNDIFQRELTRMKTKPAQVISYKYGANELLKLKTKASKEADFSLYQFHKKILDLGEMPFKVLKMQM